MCSHVLSCIKRALDIKDTVTGYVGVTLCGSEVGVAKEGLDVSNVGSVFEQMGGKSVAETVN